MIAITVIAATMFALPLMSRRLVAAIATIFAVALVIRSRLVAAELIVRTDEHRKLDYDRKPSRSERRAMRRGLKLALDQAELRSLFPATMARAETWAEQVVL
ncbi:hypothetical protein DAH66_14100 [Sphingomonas koreensis]|uniref:Uncharacterized protein n=1 Tax=Sphingomonas koreensis TaxID=93064 RepID=A0A430G1W0_9SPHN|nr:hypothetical protein [Sphingomonas koreensis]RSY81998.1 hypothetical protein DAH66_14100 [Sphingomonas koreensis]